MILTSDCFPVDQCAKLPVKNTNDIKQYKTATSCPDIKKGTQTTKNQHQ